MTIYTIEASDVKLSPIHPGEILNEGISVADEYKPVPPG